MIVWETLGLGWRIRKLIFFHVFAHANQAICWGYLLAFYWRDWWPEKLEVHIWIGRGVVARLFFARRNHGFSDACLNIDCVMILLANAWQRTDVSFRKIRLNFVLCRSINWLVAPSSLIDLLFGHGRCQTFFCCQMNSISCSIYYFAAPIHDLGVFGRNEKNVRFLSWMLFRCFASAASSLFGCKSDFLHVLELVWTTITSVASGNFRAHFYVCVSNVVECLKLLA